MSRVNTAKPGSGCAFGFVPFVLFDAFRNPAKVKGLPGFLSASGGQNPSRRPVIVLFYFIKYLLEGLK